MNRYIVSDLYQYQGIKLYDDLGELVFNINYVFDFMERPFLNQNGLKKHIFEEIRRTMCGYKGGVPNYIKIWKYYLDTIQNPDSYTYITMKIPFISMLSDLINDLGQFSDIYDDFYSPISGIDTRDQRIILFQIFQRYIHKWAPEFDEQKREKVKWKDYPLLTTEFEWCDPLFDSSE